MKRSPFFPAEASFSKDEDRNVELSTALCERLQKILNSSQSYFQNKALSFLTTVLKLVNTHLPLGCFRKSEFLLLHLKNEVQ